MSYPAILCACLLLLAFRIPAQQNLLKNPGFEEPGSDQALPANWTTRNGSARGISSADGQARTGSRGISIPADTAAEQKIESLPAGAYVARCWVKSPAAQPVTFLLQDPARPWAAYTCTEIQVPANQWVAVEAFCNLDRAGTLTLTLGGLSKEFRLYHGLAGEMKSPIAADDFELKRYEPQASEQSQVKVWDSKEELNPTSGWPAQDPLTGETQAHNFDGTPIIQGRQLVGTIRRSDGGLAIYAQQSGRLKARCVLTPSPALQASKCSLVRADGRTGIQVSSETGDRRYTAWFTANGLVSIEATQVARFRVSDCRLRYGILPSFVGSDIFYTPARMPGGKEFNIPSTQWFVGLVDGGDSMMVAVWESGKQAVALGLSSEGSDRLIDSLSVDTREKGFSISFVEHGNVWHREPLKEDWLGEYTQISWQRPFDARWMSHFFVSPGGKPSFREPFMDYSFPIAFAKTRMWGVWFEDWNHYPAYFDGPRTILHFEKTFVPNGDELLYFLEPAAADLFSPCEIVQQSLGSEKAEALFDFDANQLRQLKYSTPDQFMYDRPVCATTTRLSKIKQDEKPTVGVNLATHLYEFIREIRGRVDQYAAFFNQMKEYLADENKNHPELEGYVRELQTMIGEAQSKTEEIYATPLTEVQTKINSMKEQLREGKGDGFECGKLDVRDTAGSQDDLCRRYNRLVLRLTQTAAFKCGDSAEKAVIAKYIWDHSREVLRRPTRWEPRRTLYFFEP